MVFEAVDFFGQPEESGSQPLDLRDAERAGVDAAKRLAFEQFAEQFDHCEHQLCQAVADVVRLELNL